MPAWTDDSLAAIEKDSFLGYCGTLQQDPSEVALAFLQKRIAANKPVEDLFDYEAGEPVDVFIKTWRNIVRSEIDSAARETAAFLAERFTVFEQIAHLHPDTKLADTTPQRVIDQFADAVNRAPALMLSDRVMQAYVRYGEVNQQLRANAIVINHVLAGIASNFLSPFFTYCAYSQPKLRLQTDAWIEQEPILKSYDEMVVIMADYARNVALNGLGMAVHLPYRTTWEYHFGFFVYHGIYDFVLFHEVSHIALNHNPLKVSKAAELQADRLAANLLWNRNNQLVQFIKESRALSLMAARAIAPILFFHFLSLVEAIADLPPTTHPAAQFRAAIITYVTNNILAAAPPEVREQFEDFTKRLLYVINDAAAVLKVDILRYADEDRDLLMQYV